MERLSIDEMKQIELEIMDEIDRICRENGIAYFLGYGSCLGAMRHGGFIPWDDDLDVVMLREDYERFFEIFDQERSSDRFALVSYRDKTSPQAFFKVVDVTTKVEEHHVRPEHSRGVWVDIFPLDRVNDASAPNMRSMVRNQKFRYLAVTRLGIGTNMLVRIVKRLAGPIFHRIGPYGFAREVDERARTGEHADGSIVADLVAGYTLDDRFPRDLFEPLEVEFEGPEHKYFVPKGYEEYLTTIYGDWKTPPPDKTRDVHTGAAYRLR